MKIRLAAFRESNGQRFISYPDGQTCEGLITFRNGLSIEEFDTDQVPSQLALMAAMNGWYAEIDGEYCKIRIKDRSIIIIKGPKDELVLKSHEVIRASVIKPEFKQPENTGPKPFIGSDSMSDDELEKLTDPNGGK